MTDEEKMAVKEECKKFILKDENLSKNVIPVRQKIKSGFLSTFQQEKE